MPPAGATDTTKEAVTAEIKPDPDYEFRRKALDLVQEWQNHDSESTEDNLYREETILPKVKELVRHNLTNNAEIEACDLLMEIERIDILKEMAQQLEHLDYERICLYILRFYINLGFVLEIDAFLLKIFLVVLLLLPIQITLL